MHQLAFLLLNRYLLSESNASKLQVEKSFMMVVKKERYLCRFEHGGLKGRRSEIRSSLIDLIRWGNLFLQLSLPYPFHTFQRPKLLSETHQVASSLYQIQLILWLSTIPLEQYD
jgi:hypothetical protein